MKDYTDYNYTELVDKITELYKDEIGSGDGYQGSAGQMLIELLADTTDNLHFMLERRVQEGFLSSARLSSSIWYHASSVGYRPRRRVSSIGTLELTILDEDDNPSPPIGSVRIEKGETVSFDGFTYTVTDDTLLDSTQSSNLLYVIEGSPKEEVFTLDASGEIIIEDYVGIEERSLVVIDSGGDQYYDVRDPASGFINVTSLNFAPPDAKLYDIKYSNEGMRIVFGDGEYGFRPTGDVTIKWVDSSGGEAAFVATGREFKFDVDTLPDQTEPNDYSYTLINTTPVRGGQDEESDEEIKFNAPSYVRSANRAVTSEDYRFWVRKSGIGDIVDLNVYSEHDTKTLIYTMNNVFVTYLTSDNVPLSLNQKKNLREFINQYRTLTNHVIIDEAEKVNLALDIKAKKFPQFPVTREHFYNIIKDLSGEYLDVKEGAIGRDFQHSEFVEFMQKATYRINGVEYPIFDFIYVDVEAEYQMKTPPQVYEVSVRLRSTYTPTAGDVLALSIDGVEYSTPINSTSSVVEIMRNLRDEVLAGSSMLVALDGLTLFIRAPSETGTFQFNVVDNGSDVVGSLETSIIYNIPKPSGDESEPSILPSSAYIMTNDRSTILYEDNGTGRMASPIGRSSINIDYRASKIFASSIFEEDVILRFKQNNLKNFKGDQATAVLLAPFSPDFNTMDEGASKIQIIENRG